MIAGTAGCTVNCPIAGASRKCSEGEGARTGFSTETVWRKRKAEKNDEREEVVSGGTEGTRRSDFPRGMIGGG
jgi:hypothetical protein